MNVFCCKELDRVAFDGESAITYLPKIREFGVKLLRRKSSVFDRMRYCSFCGKKLPDSLRLKWFEILEKKGLEPDEDLPEELRSDKWWREKMYD